MDEMVLAAMQKWPNVPDVFGWLGLDARGHWLLRGERIGNPVFNAFISRNYTCDQHGRWFFQNGPQRVFVKFEAAPLVGRLTDFTLTLHTGPSVVDIEAIAVDDQGGVWFKTARGPVSLHDHDLEEWLKAIDKPVSTEGAETMLANWLAGTSDVIPHWKGIALTQFDRDRAGAYFGFIADPRP